MFARLAL